MRKLVLGLILFILFINGSCDGDQSSEEMKGHSEENTEIKGEFNTEAAIFKHLQTKNSDLEQNDVCIDKVDEFKDLFLIGYFAYDKGCGLDEIYFNGNEYPTDHSISKEILQTANFQSDPEKAVEKYHINVIHHFRTVIYSNSDDFQKAGYEFSAPKTEKTSENIISTAWVIRPPGMVPETSYFLSRVIFDLEGNFISYEKISQFAIPIEH
ncbi:MAG: hypothetical protein H6600_08670 [Flavobacteriales bacterium]|nr:hypothetical protein [Flavobacteriales bacterium]